MSEKEPKNYTKEELKKLPFMDESLDIEKRVEDLLNRMTFEEKCHMNAGEGEGSPGVVERLGIPLFGMTDGPHGLSPGATRKSAHYLASTGVEASTKFPPSIQHASTFNLDLIYKFGVAIAEETRAVGRKMILGPAMNICRTPMNGRTFEYYSEDPYLSGELGAAAINGIQSRRIAPCVKHYVANNFESNRFKVNIVVDRRTLEEIYFSGFKRMIEKSDPWSVMSSYNKINGIYVSEHKEILRTFLKDEWGFSGCVVSDWGATNHVTGIKGLVDAGLDIEMGGRTRYVIDEMKAMRESGELSMEYVDDNTKRILRTYFRVGIFDDPSSIPEGSLNTKEHQEISKKIAEEGMILLKNENKILPLDINKVKKIAILGKHADMRTGRKKLGGGSSCVFPPYEITIRAGLEKKCEGKIEIVEDPAEADVAIVCVGLEHSHDFKGGDHEGSDKLRYQLGVFLPKLINKTVKANPNTIVVFLNGSPFGVERFVNNVPAILEAWYGGMEVGTVVADILFGDVNPSGKLPVSWPKHKKDIHTRLSFTDTIIPVKEVVYEEGIFIGYRYYDKEDVTIEPRYCFGYGLSYTEFKYDNLKLSNDTMKGDDKLKITFEISNIGDRKGDEIAQLYIRDVESSVSRPVKELKGFKRVVLESGAKTTVELEIAKIDLSFFDVDNNEWKAEEGEFEVQIGKSSQEIILKQQFNYQNS